MGILWLINDSQDLGWSWWVLAFFFFFSLPFLSIAPHSINRVWKTDGGLRNQQYGVGIEYIKNRAWNITMNNNK